MPRSVTNHRVVIEIAKCATVENLNEMPKKLTSAIWFPSSSKKRKLTSHSRNQNCENNDRKPGHFIRLFHEVVSLI